MIISNKLMVTEENGREGIIRESGMDMYTLLYLKWITNKDLLFNTWNSVQWERRLGRMDTCMAESLCCLPETIITLLIGYTPK